MTVEIRTGAKRGEQKGTAGTKKFKREKRLRVDRKRTLSFTKRVRDVCVCPVACMDQNKLFVILK